MKEKLLNHKGISLISLSITVMIILIITGTIIYNVKDNLKVEELEKMQQDIENLSDKIDTYYAQYGKIPAKFEAEYTNISEIEDAGVVSQAVDTGRFYVIDLQAIENLTLSYGQDYEAVKTFTDSAQINEYTNLYIINEASHNIFYAKGIELDGEMFYTNYTAEDIDTEAVVLINIDEIEDNWSPVYDTNGVYKDKNGDTAIIPAGFKVSRTSGMDTIYGGLVIQDQEGNEFVWIPVSKENFEEEFVRRAGYRNGIQEDITIYGEANEVGINTKITESDETQLEAKKMYASVKANGGFYIGRYEAGTTVADGKGKRGETVSKKEANIYNYIGWNKDTTNNDIKVETGGAVEVARNFATEKGYDLSKVQSTLCYGVQWDTALNFIDPGYVGYAKDSSKMGWYSDNYNTTTSGNTESNELLLAGKDLIYTKNSTVIANKHKNLYDMGGNVCEWTMEVGNNNRVLRGGDFGNTVTTYSASTRSWENSSEMVATRGFRIALYINDNISEEDLPETPDIGDTTTVEAGKIVRITQKDNYTDKENKTATIPAGFTVSMIPTEQTITTGLVIYDIPEDEIEDVNWTAKNADGSYQVQTLYEQFIWVPVSNDNFTTEFVREHFGEEHQKWWYGTFVTDQLGYMNMYEPAANGIDVNTAASDSIQETQKMYKSVKDNEGFYIGRYEAGNDGSGNVLCKRGVSVYNNIGWNNTNNMADETGGAVEKARGFSKQNDYDSVTSTLVYGVQWDAVMRWISKDDGLKGYLKDSSQIGNYDDNNNTNNPAKTGAVEEYKLKNIYDMAGNVCEWTMEAYSTNERVFRGGDYDTDGASYPVSDRESLNPSSRGGYIGFRVAMYVI